MNYVMTGWRLYSVITLAFTLGAGFGWWGRSLRPALPVPAARAALQRQKQAVLTTAAAARREPQNFRRAHAYALSLVLLRQVQRVNGQPRDEGAEMLAAVHQAERLAATDAERDLAEALLNRALNELEIP